ncbi:MAG: [protein-PII] uridylyltransferase [Desulfomonilaceae bacterium]
MRFIFSTHDKPEQIRRIRDGIVNYREAGQSDPANFQMHPLYDELLCQVCDHFLGYWKGEVALIGLGGYGRREMSPYSDIDLLFLRPENAPEGIYRAIRNILYLLWDARVELGHSVRTVNECKQEADRDLAVLTSLMDIRLIWGCREIFDELVVEREQLINDTDPLDLYLRIETEIRKSRDKFGHTIYLLEPHLKEGPGSLRYVQLLTWLARMIFGCATLDDLVIAELCSERSVAEIKQGVGFLAEIRTRLHFIEGRRDDRLKFDCQALVAGQMGFVETPERPAVENFMREYYRHAAVIDFFGRQLLAKARLFMRPKLVSNRKRLELGGSFYLGAGGINFSIPDQFLDDPSRFLQAFKLIAETGSELDIRLVDLIRSNLSKVNNEVVNDPACNSIFIEIIENGKKVSKALNTMMKVGFLERFIPAFARIRFLPQYDIYHQYTVDLHTIAVLENMDELEKADGPEDEKFLRTVFSKLEKPANLRLAGLFHDIAKGSGSGHEIRGESVARPILERLGLPAEDIEDIVYLIRNHLAMTHLAFKKDIHDEALVNRFAENVMLKRRLDLLLLLTYSDLKAVGPTALNSWKKMLLEELYYRTLDLIEGGEDAGEDLSDWVKEIKAVVWELVPAERRGKRLEEFLARATPRYCLDFYPGVIVDHFMEIEDRLSQARSDKLASDDFIARKTDHRKPGYSSITLIIADQPGLFYKIAGTLSSNRINILSSWTHLIGPIAISTLHVNNIPEGPLDDPERWENFQKDFRSVITGETDIDSLVESRRQTRGVFGRQTNPRFPVKVEIDNSTSDNATIIEVNAHDRPGLLYDITRRLSGLGLNIVLAKVSTEVDQAADIFYTQDATGAKITDFDTLDHIKEELRSHLAAMERISMEKQPPTQITF